MTPQIRHSSFVFIQPQFWRSLGWGLAADWGSKILVNVMIPPLDLPGLRVSDIEGKVFPYPPGRVAITHAEHWQETWPDLEGGGPVAWATNALHGVLDRIAPFDVSLSLVYVAILLSIPLLVALMVLWDDRQHWPYAVAMGFWFAGGVGNQVEVALFGHATDWIWVRVGEQVIFANFADIMIWVGFPVSMFGVALAVGRGSAGNTT